MDQRTCNIIMCCKGHCHLPGGKDQGPLKAVAAYMSHECACPIEDYKGRLMESILREALYDYFGTAENPAFSLRQLLDRWPGTEEPTLSQRIASMFSLARVNRNGQPVNGFTDELLAQSRIDLGECPGRATGLPDDRPVGDGQCGGCADDYRTAGGRCDYCRRYPGGRHDPDMPDWFRPAPGLFCRACAHRADKPKATGLPCFGCKRSPVNAMKSGFPDLYEKEPDQPDPSEAPAEPGGEA